MGWVYGTSADIIRAERETPTRAELAQRLPRGTDGKALLEEAIRRKNEKSPGP